MPPGKRPPQVASGHAANLEHMEQDGRPQISRGLVADNIMDGHVDGNDDGVTVRIIPQCKGNVLN